MTELGYGPDQFHWTGNANRPMRSIKFAETKFR